MSYLYLKGKAAKVFYSQIKLNMKFDIQQVTSWLTVDNIICSDKGHI